MTSTRSYSKLIAHAGSDTRAVLDSLADATLDPQAYGAAMERIGRELGELFAAQCEVEGRSVYLALTVEDADFLAAGIADALTASGAEVGVACFWNVRQKRAGIPWLDIATIADEYAEPVPDGLDHLIVVKSIISGACVVKTNLAHLLARAEPARIHVMAPVLLEGAEERLAAEFEPEVAERFEYWVFATDSEKDQMGNVLPGIGGEIYSRLGFKGQASKNQVLPRLILARSGRGSAQVATEA